MAGCSRLGRAGAILAVFLALAACQSRALTDVEPIGEPTKPRAAGDWVIASPPGISRPPFRFEREDDRLLDEIQRGAFWYLWNACDAQTGMVHDRTSVSMASVAGVGFQLAAIPVGVERGWIGKELGRERAARILRALDSCPTNRKKGLFFHFLDGRTAAPLDNDAVSTIDSAILFSGMIVAGEFFGGEIKDRAGRFLDAADWSFFTLNAPRPNEPYLKGFVSLGWKPKNFSDPTGDGSLLPYAWADAADEQRLVCFLSAGASNPARRVDPAVYYRLRRMLGSHASSGVHVWFPWSGALFTHFFAQCFIDYAHMPPDDPAAHGASHRPRVDWWENARRGVELHRIKANENPLRTPTSGDNAWGLTASDAPNGYAVPGVFPTRLATTDQVPQVDFADFTPKDDFGDGTVAPYGAGCAIMFNPTASIAALRHYRSLTNGKGGLLVWRDPGSHGQTGEFGFRDAFNAGTGWVAADCVAIDEGPLVLAIENARSGQIWKLFHGSEWTKASMRTLGLSLNLQSSR
jgi:hypothetical protein